MCVHNTDRVCSSFRSRFSFLLDGIIKLNDGFGVSVDHFDDSVLLSDGGGEVFLKWFSSFRVTPW